MRRPRNFLAFALILAFTGISVVAAECPAPEGSQVTSIELKGLQTTRPVVVNLALENHIGGFFACAKWEEERNRLRDLDIFSEVSLEAEVQGDSAALVYRFRELPPYIPFVTASQTDQDGFSIGPALASLNFLGTGKRVEAMARFLGTTEYQASVSGRQLFGLPVEFDAAWIHVDSHNSFGDFHEDSHRLKVDGFWPVVKGFGPVALSEYFYLRSDSQAVTLRAGGDRIPRLGGGLRLDLRDRALLPRQGTFAELRGVWNGGFLNSPADFFELLLDVRAYAPLTRRIGFTGNALYRRRSGVLGKSIGLYDRFYAGGSNTLRGFGENSLRGQSELLFNGEYRFDVIREHTQSLWRWSLHYAIQAVAGMDAAGLWNGPADYPLFVKSGGYAGIHLLLPGVERIRLEIGTEISRFDLLIHFGLLEKTTVQRYRVR